MKPRNEAKAAAATPALPVQALLQASEVWTQVPAQFVEGWQRQVNANLRMLDVMLANAVRFRDAQLPAMGENVARMVELQKSLLEAKTPLEAWSCQCNWMVESTSRAMNAWKELFDAAGTANASLFSCLREEAQKSAGEKPLAQAGVSTPGTRLATHDLVKTAMVSVDAAYGQMVKGTQQMMAAATEAMNAGLRFTTPPVASAGVKPATRREPH